MCRGTKRILLILRYQVKIRMVINKIIVIIITVILLSYVILRAITFIQIDQCLDSGGYWNYMKERCISFQTNENQHIRK
jgi:hypothetical protein